MKLPDSRNTGSLWEECKEILDSPGIYLSIYSVSIILLTVILISMSSRELIRNFI